jgi:hypothetical protein
MRCEGLRLQRRLDELLYVRLAARLYNRDLADLRWYSHTRIESALNRRVWRTLWWPLSQHARSSTQASAR